MEVQGKICQENGPKAEKDKTESATGLGRRTRQEILEKWVQTDSAEISDRGETSEMPRPPFEDAVTKHVPDIYDLLLNRL